VSWRYDVHDMLLSLEEKPYFFSSYEPNNQWALVGIYVYIRRLHRSLYTVYTFITLYLAFINIYRYAPAYVLAHKHMFIMQLGIYVYVYVTYFRQHGSHNKQTSEQTDRTDTESKDKLTTSDISIVVFEFNLCT